MRVVVGLIRALGFAMVFYHFCPQALAEALKVNNAVTNIVLSRNEIGNEGAEAWCLARGSVAPGHGMLVVDGD